MLAIAATLANGSQVRAAEVTFVLDGLSFFEFEGTGQTGALPAGAAIAARLDAVSKREWRLVIDPGALANFPEITYPSGRRVAWRLSASAVGRLQLGPDGDVSCTIEMPLLAHIDGSTQGAPFPLTFTTGQATSTASGVSASGTGQPIDAKSGVLQLVATGVSPSVAETAPGRPFLAVLTARIAGLPSSFAR